LNVSILEVILVQLDQLEILELSDHRAAEKEQSTPTPTVKDLLVSATRWFINATV